MFEQYNFLQNDPFISWNSSALTTLGTQKEMYKTHTIHIVIKEIILHPLPPYTSGIFLHLCVCRREIVSMKGTIKRSQEDFMDG